MCQIDIVDDIYEQWISLFVDVFIRNLSKSTFKLYGIRRKHSAWTTHVIQWIFFEFHNRKFSIHKVVNERVFDSSNWIYNIRCGFFFWIAVNKSIFTNFETNFWKTTTFFDWFQFVQMNEIELFGVNVSSLRFHTFISISFILQFYWQCINENEIQINSSSSIGANVYI